MSNLYVASIALALLFPPDQVHFSEYRAFGSSVPPAGTEEDISLNTLDISIVAYDMSKCCSPYLSELLSSKYSWFLVPEPVAITEIMKCQTKDTSKCWSQYTFT